MAAPNPNTLCGWYNNKIATEKNSSQAGCFKDFKGEKVYVEKTQPPLKRYENH